MLLAPMLDDRYGTVSATQYGDQLPWTRGVGEMAWECTPGRKEVRDESVGIYAVPGRTEDLSNLPQAYIDVGSAEVFGDKSIAYASGLLASGCLFGLHVWPSAFHGSDLGVPEAAILKAGAKARDDWIARMMK
ncbi:hypothetical protein BDV38DRAFT_248903 [Aspergillus pseudotamarii]|uniref:Alpha/beta hydrolase fold-3 domain-containing protein n=1 Tax=Aspergillus pseudotamarii TaxID=132259 RepID=A0A5N6SS34_ASPPS|nr:uncharacterized protein BDV38DRAFT_248903 [Aspergillus pseudotamarii]KAE8136687.1 hypothetical protein BDV38DRAFT_248903 [Aspergillus pseudotamarii]